MVRGEGVTWGVTGLGVGYGAERGGGGELSVLAPRAEGPSKMHSRDSTYREAWNSTNQATTQQLYQHSRENDERGEMQSQSQGQTKTRRETKRREGDRQRKEDRHRENGESQRR